MSHKQILYNYFLQYDPGLPAHWDEIQEAFQYVKVPAGAYLMEESQICDKLYFLKHGLFRVFKRTEEKDISVYFIHQNRLFTAFDAFHSGSKSILFYEALEDSEVFLIKKQTFDHLYETVPVFAKIIGRFYQERMSQLFYQKNIYQSLSPYERFSLLMKNNPHYFQRIPQHHLASFLGITPVSFSRIKKRYFENHNNPKK
ncbi:Crp/Fnr family transcriptional regulator [Persicobacter diffluens]|uniref:cAMP-binding protein n=1 Tax=Persicobacter diffluens TaxID=981 RepID=A0AAN4VYQ9_9BACT|nr:cAMP-binding protein [Persicobacter diffluens]